MLLLKCIFKLIHKHLLHYFKQFTFTFRNQQHDYDSRTCQNVFIPNVNQEFAAKRSIRFIAPATYNSTHGTLLTKYTLNVLLDFVYVQFQLIYSCTVFHVADIFSDSGYSIYFLLFFPFNNTHVFCIHFVMVNFLLCDTCLLCMGARDEGGQGAVDPTKFGQIRYLFGQKTPHLFD